MVLAKRGATAGQTSPQRRNAHRQSEPMPHECQAGDRDSLASERRQAVLAVSFEIQEREKDACALTGNCGIGGSYFGERPDENSAAEYR